MTFFVLITSIFFASFSHSSELVLKVDRVTLNTPNIMDVPPVSVTFDTPFSVPPVVFLLPDNANSEPSTVRVVSVSTTGFELGISEAEGGDTSVTPLTFVRYMAIEPGDHTLSDGTRFLVGTIDVSSSVGKNDGVTDVFTTLNFTPAFPSTPVVILELQTVNNDPDFATDVAQITSPWLEVSARSSSPANIQVSLERAETSNGSVTAAETIGYAAMIQTTGTIVDSASNTIAYESFISADNITGNCVATGNPNSANPATFSNTYAVEPLVIANQVKRDGGDGGWAQWCSGSTSNVGLTVEEDVADDTERDHTDEALAVMVFSQEFDAVSPAMEVKLVSTPASSDEVVLDFTSVSFPNAFESIPLIFPMPTDEGANPTGLRVRNVSASGFDIAQVVPLPQITATDPMTVDYIAITEGVHTLPDGTVLEAGSLLTNNTVDSTVGDAAGEVKIFSHTFTAAPSMLAQIQSTNSEPGLNPNFPSVPWMVSVILNRNTTQATFALDRLQVRPSEPATATIVSEQIGYLAAEPNLNQTLTVLSGADVFIKTFNYGGIQGIDDGTGCFFGNIPAPNPFTSTPLGIAHTISRAGSDGVFMRRCGISSTNIGLYSEEDIALDAERNHAAETASVFMFSEAFEWCPLPISSIIVTKTIDVVSDPINLAVNPKIIPGTLLEYTINVENDSPVTLDAGLLVKDVIPNNVELFVGDLDGSGSPVIVTEGGASGEPSGVGTPDFVNLTSLTDDIEFSDDNGMTYNYMPVSVGGFDDNVTHIRIKTPSTFNGRTDTLNPAFSVTLRVRVK